MYPEDARDTHAHSCWNRVIMTPSEIADPERSPHTPPRLEPGLKQLFMEWFRIGATSFGGGASVLHMIDTNLVRQREWISGSQVSRLFAMCQLAPGINLLALCLLIGWHLRGARGAFVSILGFIIPSAAITVIVSLVYARFRDLPPTRSALRGMFAAIFGLGLVADWRFTEPLLRQACHDLRRVALVIVILIGSALAYALFHPPVLVLYALGAGIGAIGAWYFARDPSGSRS